MSSKLFENICIVFGIFFSILLGKLFWGWIDIDFVDKFKIVGEYSKFKYNPLNESIKYVIFIFIPLATYFLLISYFKKSKIKKIKEIFFYKNSLSFESNRNNTLNLILFFLLILILFEFLSISFPIHKLDFFHEGQWLTAGMNYIKKGGMWRDSYITVGFYHEIFIPIIGLKLFDIMSVGSSRFAILLSIFFFKIFIVLFVYKLTSIQKMSENFKILFFVIISLITLNMTNYLNTGTLDYRELPLILFFIFLIPIITNEKKVLIYCFLVGFLSVISVLWGLDRGAYLNATLISFIIFLILGKRFKSGWFIVFGVIVGWVLFYAALNPSEFSSFLYNTKTIYQSQEWSHGIIHPDPFSSDDNSARATKIMLILISSGLIVINFNFFKYNNLSNESKILLIFIFILAVISYRTALGRSDGPHIRSVTGLPVMLFSIVIFNLIYDFLKKNKKTFSLKKGIFITSIYLFVFVSFAPNLNLKKIIDFKSRVNSYVNLNDEFFMSKKQTLLVEKYKNFTNKDNCVIAFTYETAIPYLLKKPSCNKYYYTWNIANKKNQNEFIKSIIIKKPNFALMGGEYSGYDSFSPQQRLPIIYAFLIENYEFVENISDWKIYKIK